eukprot:12805608-Heterocapsa_arctica.AAC.1
MQADAKRICCPIAMLQSEADECCPHKKGKAFLDQLAADPDRKHFVYIREKDPNYKCVIL